MPCDWPRYHSGGSARSRWGRSLADERLDAIGGAVAGHAHRPRQTMPSSDVSGRDSAPTKRSLVRVAVPGLSRGQRWPPLALRVVLEPDGLAGRAAFDPGEDAIPDPGAHDRELICVEPDHLVVDVLGRSEAQVLGDVTA
jgi:hypothetical protein